MKDITEDILLKAGFMDASGNTFKLRIKGGYITLRYSQPPFGRCWKCSVNNNIDMCTVDIQTIEHFNKLMELMGMELRLEEEKNLGDEITKQVLFDAGFKVGGTHENLFKLEHGDYKIMIGPVEDNANGKKFLCTVDEPRRKVRVASIAISTVTDFNKLMNLMGIDFRLKEE